jgi:HAD superfamily hydrolase (TIGR01549 family)
MTYYKSSGQMKNIEYILGLDKKVYSFDIFDTVLTRSTATPTGIFAIMEMKVRITANHLPAALKQNFSKWRMKAEREARAYSAKEEITLEDIYRNITDYFKLDPGLSNLLMAMEINEEMNALRSTPKLIHVLNELRKENKRIIFVSDMYLPEDVVKKMLVKVGAYRDGDGLYVSSRCAATKATGKLFTHILARERCLPSEIIHVGDNWASDFLASRRVGIESLYFPDAQLNRYESLLLNAEDNRELPADYLKQIIAGASRCARINRNKESTRNNKLYEIGANVAGPVLLGYIIWVLNEAQKMNIKRLYFLSRDGQVLLEIAEKALAKINLDIDVRYLYASRQAWFLPATTKIDDDFFTWALRKYDVLTLRMVASRVELVPEIIQKEFYDYTHKDINADEPLSHNDIDSLKDVLKRGRLSSLILFQADEARKRVINYFQQEGLLEDISWAIVDLGWQGNLQHALAVILGRYKETTKSTVGFYFGLTAWNKKECNFLNKKMPFLFSPDSPKSFWSIGANFINLLEVITAADHGTTYTYYHSNKGLWCPKLKESENTAALRWGLKDLRSGCFGFLNQLTCGELSLLRQNPDIYKLFVIKLMHTLAENPTRQEAIAIGDFKFCSGQTDSQLRYFAPKFSFLESLYFSLTYLWPLRPHLTFWLPGTRRRSNFLVHFFLWWHMVRILSKMGSIYYEIGVRIKQVFYPERVV